MTAAAPEPPPLTPAQVRALVAPARQEIVDVLSSAGPCPVARLAALLGRPADALYHHLRVLSKAKLVTATDAKEGRHRFAVYDLAIRPLKLSYDPPVRPADILRVVAGAQRLTWREFRRAVLRRQGTTHGPGRTVWGARGKGWVTAENLVRLNALLAEALDLVQFGPPSEGATPVSLSFVLAPSPPARRARPRAQPASPKEESDE